MRALLDINLLIALLDASHMFHQRAHAWWAARTRHGWASSPLVENGMTRIMTNPAYSASRRFVVEEVVHALSKFVAATNHEFWPDNLTLRDAKFFATDRIHGGKRITDLYLLALAIQHKGQLVTFDQGIVISAVKTARPKHLLVL